MKLILQFLGLLIIIIGIYLCINPNSLYLIMEANLANRSLYIGAIVGRFIFGILLLTSAKESKFPIIFKLLGGLALLASITFILIGQEGFINFVATLLPVFKPYSRMVGFLTVVFGGFLIYAFLEAKKSEIIEDKR